MKAIRSRAPSTSSWCEGESIGIGGPLASLQDTGVMWVSADSPSGSTGDAGNVDRMIPDLLSSLPLSGFLVLEHRLKQILIYHCYNEFTDELADRHVPERCLKRE
jgi:hypothetical protein